MRRDWRPIDKQIRGIVGAGARACQARQRARRGARMICMGKKQPCLSGEGVCEGAVCNVVPVAECAACASVLGVSNRRYDKARS